MEAYRLRPIGWVRSALKDPAAAPKQNDEGAPEASIEIEPEFLPALDGLEPGQDIIAVTWLHLADRSILAVHPRDDPANPLTGVFATRSADRPNPLGLHRTRLLRIEDERTLVLAELEAVDGTPVVDLKPALTIPAGRRGRPTSDG